MSFVTLLSIIIVLSIIGTIAYWQLIIAEGAYLGVKVVAHLYDWTADRYNDIKAYDDDFEDSAVGEPLANRLYFQPHATVLDVGTGTGRTALNLLRQPTYQGQIIGLDRSPKMLAVAQRALADHEQGDRVTLILADSMALPFADNSVPMVTCLEMLEFLPDPKHGLTELMRVTAPANETSSEQGWLLTSRRIGWEAWLMPGKTWSKETLLTLLAEFPVQYIDIRPWQTIYDLVWMQKIDPSQT